MQRKKLVVVGGGAAGFFCAVNAARLNSSMEVILLEKSAKLLSKVRISGGGRCNLTHACYDIQEMSLNYPRGSRFVKKTFHQFFTTDTIEWFESRGVKLKTEKDGRIFPISDLSQSVIDCLLNEATIFKVDVRLQSELRSMEKVNDQWKLHTNRDEVIADYVCIASGGYPKLSMFDWLTFTGHNILEPVPSLFTFNLPGHPITRLMGVSVENAVVKIEGSKLEQQGPLLITHWGFSGPAVLKLSAWAARELHKMNYDCRILINWLPALNQQQVSEKLSTLRFDMAAMQIGTRNQLGLPQRLWEFLLESAGIDVAIRWADLPAKQQQKLVTVLSAGSFDMKGKTTFKEEFVTAGGIDLREIDHNTMESKKNPNLYFAGEILDVDGVTGGFNFQHAWTSGFIVAKAVMGRS